MKINQEGESSLIHVIGTATLNGGTVELNDTDGYCLCSPYKILHAEEGVEGDFSSLPFSNLSLKQNLTYKNNVVYVTICPDLIKFAKTPNQTRVAEQIESINDPSSDNIELVKNLVSVSRKEISSALDLISGEQLLSTLLLRINAPPADSCSGSIPPCVLSL